MSIKYVTVKTGTEIDFAKIIPYRHRIIYDINKSDGNTEYKIAIDDGENETHSIYLGDSKITGFTTSGTSGSSEIMLGSSGSSGCDIWNAPWNTTNSPIVQYKSKKKSRIINIADGSVIKVIKNIEQKPQIILMSAAIVVFVLLWCIFQW